MWTKNWLGTFLALTSGSKDEIPSILETAMEQAGYSAAAGTSRRPGHRNDWLHAIDGAIPNARFRLSVRPGINDGIFEITLSQEVQHGSNPNGYATTRSLSGFQIVAQELMRICPFLAAAGIADPISLFQPLDFAKACHAKPMSQALRLKDHQPFERAPLLLAHVAPKLHQEKLKDAPSCAMRLCGLDLDSQAILAGVPAATRAPDRCLHVFLWDGWLEDVTEWYNIGEGISIGEGLRHLTDEQREALHFVAIVEGNTIPAKYGNLAWPDHTHFEIERVTVLEITSESRKLLGW